MKAFRFLFFLLMPALVHAQGNGFGSNFDQAQNGFSGLKSFYNVVNSEPITAPVNPRQLQGSPFFSDEWLKGIITLSDGKSYSAQQLKIDLLNTKLYFINQSGQEKLCISPVDRVILLDSVTGQVHTFIHSLVLPAHPELKDSVWLEVLQPGKAELVKYHKKELIEKSSYASAPVDVIKTQTRYYLVHNERIYKVNSFRDLRNIFIMRDKEMDEYFSKGQRSWKSEADIATVVAYYNSIVGN
jgi:hypothetical protein